MNTSVKQRYILRAIVAGLLTAAGALKAYLPGLSTEDIIDVVVTGIVGTGLYTGIGAASPWVEPNIGKKLNESGVKTTR